MADWLTEAGYGPVERSQQVAGGCINNGARLETSSGESFFLKQNAGAPTEMFEREFEGLTALAESGFDPLSRTCKFMLTEELRPAGRASDYWERLGAELAALHNQEGEAFGFDNDNFIGSTRQPNARSSDGHEFFAEHRLGFQAELARGRELLSAEDVKAVEGIAGKLSNLIPEQPASLIHGDLWSGNVTSGSHGEPALIDPATHYGWAEAELGMTQLFGGFPQAFYAAYEQARPLEPGWRDRLDLYNLYHLLNHLNLFGPGYLGQVRQILAIYS